MGVVAARAALPRDQPEATVRCLQIGPLRIVTGQAEGGRRGDQLIGVGRRMGGMTTPTPLFQRLVEGGTGERPFLMTGQAELFPLPFQEFLLRGSVGLVAGQAVVLPLFQGGMDVSPSLQVILGMARIAEPLPLLLDHRSSNDPMDIMAALTAPLLDGKVDMGLGRKPRLLFRVAFDTALAGLHLAGGNTAPGDHRRRDRQQDHLPEG